jgi:hypothetical protein
LIVPTYLSDPPALAYLVLFGAVVVFGAIAARRQDRKSAAPFAAALLVLIGLYAIDRAVESPREESVRRVQEMARAAQERNAEGFVSHIAENFEYDGASGPRTISRDQLRRSPFWDVLRQFDVQVAVWDFARDDVRELGDNRIEIGFMAKGEARETPYPMYLRATFQKQADGQMKLVKFASFDPVKRQNERVTIPSAPFAP